MEFVKKVAVIKEEFACMSKDAQKMSLSTAEHHDQIQELEVAIDKIEEILHEEAQMIIRVGIQIEDEEMKKRMMQEQLEIVAVDRLAVQQKLAAEIDKWNAVANQALNLKSPDDYKRELLQSAEKLDHLKRQVTEERALNIKLSRQLEERKRAEAQLRATRRDIEQLKNLLDCISRETTAQEVLRSRSIPNEAQVHDLQLELEKAKQRYEYLCQFME